MGGWGCRLLDVAELWVFAVGVQWWLFWDCRAPCRIRLLPSTSHLTSQPCRPCLPPLPYLACRCGAVQRGAAAGRQLGALPH